MLNFYTVGDVLDVLDGGLVLAAPDVVVDDGVTLEWPMNQTRLLERFMNNSENVKKIINFLQSFEKNCCFCINNFLFYGLVDGPPFVAHINVDCWSSPCNH